MINIRDGLFETNSSSIHTICIAKNIPETIPSVLRFNFGEMGWGWEDVPLRDYIWTMCCLACEVYYDGGKEIDYDKLGFYARTIQDILKNHFISSECDFAIPEKDSWFYIDHPEDIPFKADDIFEDEELLVRMIVPEASFVELGNDNDDKDPRPEMERMRVVFNGEYEEM